MSSSSITTSSLEAPAQGAKRISPRHQPASDDYKPKQLPDGDDDKKKHYGRHYWAKYLKGKWKLAAGRIDDHIFIPEQYHLSYKEMKKQGAKEGVHYADGDLSLYKMLDMYGTYNGFEEDEKTGEPTECPFLTKYEGPPLPGASSSVVVTPPMHTRLNNSNDISATVSADDNNDVETDSSDDTTPDTAYKNVANFTVINGRGGHQEKISKDFKRIITEEDFCGITPKYFIDQLDDVKNYIFAGYDMGEPVSLFIFKFAGRDMEDASTSLLWTQKKSRRQGYATQLMWHGCQFLTESSMLASGTNPSSDSARVYKSQGWVKIGRNQFSVFAKDLFKTLSEKVKCKSTGNAENELSTPIRELIDLYKEEAASTLAEGTKSRNQEEKRGATTATVPATSAKRRRCAKTVTDLASAQLEIDELNKLLQAAKEKVSKLEKLEKENEAITKAKDEKIAKLERDKIFLEGKVEGLSDLIKCKP